MNGNGSSSRLLALVEREPGRAPNQRFRHEQWAPHLARDHGITIDFAPFESPELGALIGKPGRRARKLLLAVRDSVRRWMRRNDATRYDGVVVLRQATMVGGPWVESFLTRRGIPLIYDFDDAIFLLHGDGARWSTGLLQMPWKVSSICRMASAVTVGNEYLASFARRHNANVRVVRTSIDLADFKVLPPNARAPFTVVWTGSRSTLQYLDLVRPALETLAARFPLRLRVICDAPPRPFDRVQLDFVSWSPAVEASALGAGDVGIMPLPDTSTARGKCACKLLQYMAVGRPAIASPVGLNQRLIDHGRNGLHANDTDEWVEQIERLAKDPELRHRLALEGRRTVEAGFTAQRSASKFAGVVRSVLTRSRSNPS